MNALKTMLQRGRRTCGWVMFKPSIRYLVFGLLLACVGAVRPEGAGNWADSRYFDAAHVRCPVALQVAAPQELRERRQFGGGALTVSWQRLPPPFPGDAGLQAETEILVVVDAGTDHLVAQVPLDAGRAVVKSVPRGQPLDVSVALIRNGHVISEVGVLSMQATQTRAGYGVSEPREVAKEPMPSPTATATVGPPVSQPPVSQPPILQPLSNPPAATATPEPPVSQPPLADPTATAIATATATPEAGTLALSHNRNDSNEVRWLQASYTFSPQCSNNPQVKAVAGTTTVTREVTKVSGHETFLTTPFKTLGATVTLLCDGATVVEKTIAAPSASPTATATPTPTPEAGTLTLLHKRDQFNEVTWLQASYTFSPQCSNNPQVKAVAGTTTVTRDVTKVSGHETFLTTPFKTLGATVTLLCDGETVVTATIDAPE